MKPGNLENRLAERPVMVASTLAILGLATRLIWVALVPSVPEPETDPTIYHITATHIAEGLGYCITPGQPTAYWPVGPAALYGSVYAIWGPNLIATAILNALLGGMTVGLCCSLGWKAFGPRVGILAGLLMAFWPAQIQYTTILCSEVPFTFLLLAILVVHVRVDAPRFRWPALIILIGLASYLRPLALIFPLLLGWCRWISTGPSWRWASLRPIVLEGIVLAIGVAAVLAPWTIRNAVVMGTPALVSLNGGPNLWMGNSPGTTGGYRPLPVEVRDLNEVQRSQVLSARAIAYIRAEPLAFLQRCFFKFLIYHDRETHGVNWNRSALEQRFGNDILVPLKLISSAYWFATLGLAVSGVIVLLRRDGVLRSLGHLPLTFWLAFAVIHAVIVANDRYHFPVDPLIGILAAVSLEVLWRQVAGPANPQT